MIPADCSVLRTSTILSDIRIPVRLSTLRVSAVAPVGSEHASPGRIEPVGAVHTSPGRVAPPLHAHTKIIVLLFIICNMHVMRPRDVKKVFASPSVTTVNISPPVLSVLVYQIKGISIHIGEVYCYRVRLQIRVGK